MSHQEQQGRPKQSAKHAEYYFPLVNADPNFTPDFEPGLRSDKLPYSEGYRPQGYSVSQPQKQKKSSKFATFLRFVALTFLFIVLFAVWYSSHTPADAYAPIGTTPMVIGLIVGSIIAGLIWFGVAFVYWLIHRDKPSY